MKDHKGNGKSLKVLTWHIHGSYLYYLTQVPCQFYLPVKEGKPEGYGGRSGTLPWGDNVHDVSADEVRNLDLDLIIFQSKRNYEHDQYEILNEEQRRLPKIFLEHDPPREVPTDTRHHVDDPDMLLVHVTHFNKLMWDNNRTPATVISHGVVVPPEVQYKGTKEKGIVVINGIKKRGRRLGYDIFEEVRKQVPLDIVGIGSEEVGGLGEIPNRDLQSFISDYRFFFNPIRYTSLGLSVCEAMMTGVPVVGLATTEMSVAIRNGVSGYIHTDLEYLVEKMNLLLKDHSHAKKLSEGARKSAMEQFNIQRFSQDWLRTMYALTERKNVLAKAGGTV